MLFWGSLVQASLHYDVSVYLCFSGDVQSKIGLHYDMFMFICALLGMLSLRKFKLRYVYVYLCSSGYVQPKLGFRNDIMFICALVGMLSLRKFTL